MRRYCQVDIKYLHKITFIFWIEILIRYFNIMAVHFLGEIRMKKFLSVCFMVSLISFSAQAEKSDKIKELVSLMNYDKLIADTVDQQLFSTIDCVFVIPETERNTVRQHLIKAMNLQKLIDVMIDYLSRNLNEEELNDLLAFYKTPGGKKLITLQTDLSQFIAREFTVWIQEMTPQMNNFVSQLELKYSQRSGGEAQQCIAKKSK